MTIEYDAGRKRATHIESGMAVEYDSEGQYVREQNTFFKLYWDGSAIEFEGVYQTAFVRLRGLHPEWSTEKVDRKSDELNEMNFIAGEFDVNIKKYIEAMPEFPTIFLETWLRVVTEVRPRHRCSVHLKPYFNPSDGEWSLQAAGPLRPREINEEPTK